MPRDLVETSSEVTPDSAKFDAKHVIAELRDTLNISQTSELFVSVVFRYVKDVVFLLRVGRGGVHDRNGVYSFAWVNPAFTESTGIPAAAVIGKSVNEVIPEPSLSLVLGKYQRAIEERRTVRWDEVSTYPTGTRRGEVSVTPIFDATGHCAHLIGTVRDVSDQWEASQLRSRLSAILEATTDLVAFVDGETGSLQYLNKLGRRQLGLSEHQDLTSLALTDILSGSESGRQCSDLLDEARRVGEWTGTGQLVTRDHGSLPVLVLLLAHRTPSGELDFISVSCRDLTGQRKIEAELRASRDRLQHAQAISHSGYLDWDLQTNELRCSDEVYRWYGVEPEEAPTTPEFIATVVHPDDLETTQNELERAIRGEKPYDLDHRIRRKDGSVIWVHAQAELSRDSTGAPIRLLGTMVDITERKRAEQALARLNAELEQRVAERTRELAAANKELTAFSYSVSHDLRAPLRHAGGYVDLLRRELSGQQLSAKAVRYLDNIKASAHDMGVLIDDLLAFSRINNVKLELLPCDLVRITRSVIREQATSIEGRNIEWTFADLPLVTADPNLLKLVLMNLIDNAIKFTRRREKAHIELGTSGAEGERLVFFVRDNGVGFEMEYREQMFEVFHRLHRVDEFEGTGIGLANVQRIIARHGGRVWAEGRLDEGATIFFTLEAAKRVEPPPRHSSEAKESP